MNQLNRGWSLRKMSEAEISVWGWISAKPQSSLKISITPEKNVWFKDTCLYLCIFFLFTVLWHNYICLKLCWYGMNMYFCFSVISLPLKSVFLCSLPSTMESLKRRTALLQKLPHYRIALSELGPVQTFRGSNMSHATWTLLFFSK